MKISIIIGIMIMMTMSSTAFGVVLVFLDKDIYEIPTPDNPLTVFIESPGKVTISVSNGDVATVLGDTTTGEFTIYHDDYDFIEGTKKSIGESLSIESEDVKINMIKQEQPLWFDDFDLEDKAEA